MVLPRINGVNLPVFTLSAVLVVAVVWFMRPAPEAVPEPSKQWLWLEQELLEPVASERLTLAQLQRFPGALWLQARPGELSLMYRAEFEQDELSWRLQAAVQASSEELQLLQRELQLDNGERTLQTEQVLRFSDRLLESLLLANTPAFSAEAWQADAGEPRLRLEMPEGQAWVYPPRGLTAHVEAGHITLIRQVPARAMRGNGR